MGFALAEAETRARMAGHVDLAAYLSLRTANDLLAPPAFNG